MFGLTSLRQGPEIPTDIKRLDFGRALSEVIYSDLVVIGDPPHTYDPANPRWPKARMLFRAVERHLPRRPKHALRLYFAHETSLDIHHHVDVFFFWKGSVCTIDLSIKEKWPPRENHIVVNLLDMDDEAYDVLGKQIACILRSDRHRSSL